MLSQTNFARYQRKEGFMQIFGTKIRKRTLYKLAASLLALSVIIGISLCYANGTNIDGRALNSFEFESAMQVANDLRNTQKADDEAEPHRTASEEDLQHTHEGNTAQEELFGRMHAVQRQLGALSQPSTQTDEIIEMQRRVDVLKHQQRPKTLLQRIRTRFNGLRK